MASFEEPFDETVWKRRIPSTAVYGDPASDGPTRTIRAAGGGWINCEVWTISPFQARTTDPMITFTAHDGKVTLNYPPNAEPTQDSDAPVVIVTPDRRVVDIYQPDRATGRAGSIDARNTLDGSGLDGGLRAADVSALGGLIRKGEFAAGINHALAMGVDASRLDRNGRVVWPARSNDAGWQGWYQGDVPMGSLFAIPPTVNVETLGLTGGGLVLARALQQYGAYVLDQAGGGPVLYAEPACSGEAGLAQARQAMSRLVPLLVRVVNNGPNMGGGASPVTIPAFTLPSGVEGAVYGAQLQARGGDGTYKWTATQLPPQMLLSVEGVLWGTCPQAGTYPVKARVESVGITAEWSGSLKVNPPAVGGGPTVWDTGWQTTVTEITVAGRRVRMTSLWVTKVEQS